MSGRCAWVLAACLVGCAGATDERVAAADVALDVPADAAGADSEDAPPGADDSSASVCPSSASGVTGPEWAPPHAPQVACRDEDLTEYEAACLTKGALPIRCEQFRANQAVCAECLQPTEGGAATGVVLARPGVIALNVGGCIALGLDAVWVDGRLGAEDRPHVVNDLSAASSIQGRRVPEQTSCHSGVDNRTQGAGTESDVRH